MVAFSVPGLVSANALVDPRYDGWGDLQAACGRRWHPGPAPTAFFVENDANVRALAERARGAARAIRNAAVIKWTADVRSMRRWRASL